MNTSENSRKKPTGRPRGPRIQKVCLNCQKTYETCPADITKCCSMKCRDELTAKRNAVKEKKVSAWANCLACKKQFPSYPSTIKAGYDKFCSWECRVPYMKEHGMMGPSNRHTGEFECVECGTSVKIYPYDAKRRKYCSQECRYRRIKRAGSPKRKPRTTLTCAWCKKRFYKLPCQLKDSAKRRFCSNTCQGSYTVRNRKTGSVSKAETRFFDQLEAAGCAVKRQVRIGRFTFDAVVSGVNVAIEFDGEYWHSRPHVKSKDERKSISIAWAGYKLIRISEASFETDPSGTIAATISQIHTL